MNYRESPDFQEKHFTACISSKYSRFSGQMLLVDVTEMQRKGNSVLLFVVNGTMTQAHQSTKLFTHLMKSSSFSLTWHTLCVDERARPTVSG